MEITTIVIAILRNHGGRLLGVLLVVALVGGLTAWYIAVAPSPQSDTTQGESILEPAPPDPRLDFNTPFRNVKPDVRYVGDAACTECHSSICRTYSAHPMGRSAGYPSTVDSIEKYDATAKAGVEAGRFLLQVEKADDQVLHRIGLKSARPSSPEYRCRADVVIGSGVRGRSYLSIEEGSAWQSAISWFSRESQWDLSPGFDKRSDLRRPITPECLFCHVNRVEPVPQTINRYRQPLLLEQAAIGCERCHGPGSLHVAERAQSRPRETIDTSIMNPRHLSPELSAAVCEQCHLQGEERVVRRGREIFDFRPGLPFEQFVTVFVRHPDMVDIHRSVGQFEQMERSRCFIASAGKMGCTTCHDPHSTPTAETRVAFYEAKCLGCHTCSLPEPERRARDNRCLACHMPRSDSSNIAHVSVTDHTIPRRPSAAENRKGALPGTIPLVAFRHGPHAPDEAERDRDLGIALGRLSLALPPGPRQSLAATAVERLGASVGRWPGDIQARVVLASLHEARGDRADWLREAREAARLAPDSETAQSELMTAATAAGELDLAEELATRQIQQNPRSTSPFLHRVAVYSQRRQWDRVEADCRAALAINPLHPQLRLYLGVAMHHQGKIAEGRNEADLAIDMAIDPGQREGFEKWYRSMTR